MTEFALTEKAIVGRSTVDHDLLTRDDWIRGKSKGDLKSALRVVEGHFMPRADKQKELANLLSGSDVVILTQPGTSRNNLIPLALAKSIRKDTTIPLIHGDRVFSSLHNSASKHIPGYRRIFEPRTYELHHPDKFLKAVEGKRVVIVEDILTTGGSVSSFEKTLHHMGVKIKGVVAFMGNARLRVEEKTRMRLLSSLREKEIKLEKGVLIAGLTRQEAGFLIRSVNQIKNNTQRTRLEVKLNRLIDHEIAVEKKFNAVRLQHELNRMHTSSLLSTVSNFEPNELRKQYTESTIEYHKLKLARGKKAFAALRFDDVKEVVLEFPSVSQRKNFIKKSYFHGLIPLKTDDNLVVASSMTHSTLVYKDSVHLTDKKLKHILQVFKKVDPACHSLLMLSNRDWSQPLILDLKRHHDREAVFNASNPLNLKTIKVKRLNAFNSIALNKAKQNQIVSSNIKQHLQEKIKAGAAKTRLAETSAHIKRKPGNLSKGLSL